MREKYERQLQRWQAHRERVVCDAGYVGWERKAELDRTDEAIEALKLRLLILDKSEGGNDDAARIY